MTDTARATWVPRPLMVSNALDDGDGCTAIAFAQSEHLILAKIFFGDAEQVQSGEEEIGVVDAERYTRVLAAAPDMLAALKILLVQFGPYKDGDGAAKFHAVNIANEAVAKAEGKP